MNKNRAEVLGKLEEFLRSNAIDADSPSKEGVQLIRIQQDEQGRELAYLPYIGKDYFNQAHKIAFYAEAQNLTTFAEKIRHEWTDLKKTIDGRPFTGPMYRSYNFPFAEVGPWDGGFGRVICAMMLAEIGATSGQVDDMVVVSNAIRFSYRKKTVKTWNNEKAPEQLQTENAPKILRQEIRELTPSIIVAMGGIAEQALRIAVGTSFDSLVIPVHHSSGRNLKGSYAWCKKFAKIAFEKQTQDMVQYIWDRVRPYFPKEEYMAAQREEALVKQERKQNEVGEGATEKVNLQFIEERWLYFAAVLGVIREFVHRQE